MKKIAVSFLTLIIFLSGNNLLADAVIGSPAPEFSLPDTNGKTHSLSEFKGKFVVLEWNNPDCPFVRKHYDTGNMQRLQKEFTEKGVMWLAIDSSTDGKQGDYSAAEHNKILVERGSNVTALLLDLDGKVGQTYGAKTTPHMFVINPEGNVIYNGAIDSDPRAEDPKAGGVENYVESALNQAMAGQPVAKSTMPPYGCSIKYA